MAHSSPAFAFPDRSEPLVLSAAREVQRLVEAGETVSRARLNSVLHREFGGSDADGRWSVRDAHAVLELAQVLWLRDSAGLPLGSSMREAEAVFAQLETLLPNQTVRSEEQIELQQFATPPRIAWLLARACALQGGETVLEPSAGTGMLAIWAANADARLILNEISPVRRDCLGCLFPDAAVTAHDAELIDELLDPSQVPTAGLINPPYSHGVERGRDGHTAARHLRSAWKRLATGGRLAAVMPEWFDVHRFLDAALGPITLRLNVAVERGFVRHGTSITTRLVVLDKAEDGPAPVIARTSDFDALCDLVDAVPARARPLSARPATFMPARAPIRLAGLATKPRPLQPKVPAPPASSEPCTYATLDAPAPIAEQVGHYLPYRPSRIVIPGAVEHPTPLVESVAMAKAFGATSDQEIQARVFEQVSSAYYAPTSDSIRRMVLSGTVRGSDPRARLVGRDAYLAAGGRIERELFDDDDSESWVDVALLENLAQARMEEHAQAVAAEQGLAWVKPTLDTYASHDLVGGLVRLPAEPAPLTEAEIARLDELDASYDEHAAILEDEESAEGAVAAAEAAIEAIERECQEIRSRPPVLAPELKTEAGMILTLSRDGTPVLQPVFYGERKVEGQAEDGEIEIVVGDGGEGRRRSALSKRLVDELAMQRRDVLALHVASDPGLALDFLVFALADADTHDWRSRSATTLRGGAPAGPIVGFEAKDAPATAALAELGTGLDESWRSGEDHAARFDAFRLLSEEDRAAWLGFVIARTLEASLNMAGERRIAFQDHLGSLIGIDTAQWWRPTAANYFDRVSKQVILDALADVGGAELSARFASVKKADLAASAERVFAGTYITEADVRERALAWVPDVMRFANSLPSEPEAEACLGEDAVSEVGDDHQTPHELAA